MQPVSRGLSYSVWDFSAQQCLQWVPCCMVNPVPSDIGGFAAHVPHGCAGAVVLLALWGWLWMLHGSLTASQQWQSSVGQCPVNSAFFQKHRGLPALPVDTPEFSSTWQLRLRPCCSTAGSEILGKVQNSSSRASQNHELGETRLIVGISDCNST